MTQPDQDLPDRAFNHDSIAELAARSEEEWRSEIDGNAAGGLLVVGEAIFGAVSAIAALVAGVIGGVVSGVGGVFDLIASILGISNPIPAYGAAANALAAADNANVSIARLEGRTGSSEVPGGILIDDTFDRDDADMGPDYTVTHTGSGGGHIETDGNNSVYVTSGSDPAFEDALHNTPLFTVYQGVQVVQTQAIANILTPPVLMGYGRCNTAKTDRVEFRVGLSTAEIGILVAGVYTRLGAAVGITSNPGDKWYLRIGTDVDDREFVLFQNTDERCRRTDTGGTSQLGAGYEHAGYVQGAGQHIIPPFFFNQIGPPDLQSFTAYDRLPARP